MKYTPNAMTIIFPHLFVCAKIFGGLIVSEWSDCAKKTVRKKIITISGMIFMPDYKVSNEAMKEILCGSN